MYRVSSQLDGASFPLPRPIADDFKSVDQQPNSTAAWGRQWPAKLAPLERASGDPNSHCSCVRDDGGGHASQVAGHGKADTGSRGRHTCGVAGTPPTRRRDGVRRVAEGRIGKTSRSEGAEGLTIKGAIATAVEGKAKCRDNPRGGMQSSNPRKFSKAGAISPSSPNAAAGRGGRTDLLRDANGRAAAKRPDRAGPPRARAGRRNGERSRPRIALARAIAQQKGNRWRGLVWSARPHRLKADVEDRQPGREVPCRPTARVEKVRGRHVTKHRPRPDARASSGRTNTRSDTARLERRRSRAG